MQNDSVEIAALSLIRRAVRLERVERDHYPQDVIDNFRRIYDKALQEWRRLLPATEKEEAEVIKRAHSTVLRQEAYSFKYRERAVIAILRLRDIGKLGVDPELYLQGLRSFEADIGRWKNRLADCKNDFEITARRMNASDKEIKSVLEEADSKTKMIPEESYITDFILELYIKNEKDEESEPKPQ